MNDSSPEILMKVVGALASAILCLALASTGPVGAQIPPHDRHGMHTHDHSFKDAAKWSRMFDDPTRDEWQKPHQLIQVLALKPDAIVADIGAGTGYLSVRLAHMTPRGRVYGVDVEPDMVAYLRDRAAKSGLANLVAVQAKPDGLVLPEKVDMAVLLDVYHHIGDRRSYFRKLKDQLKPGGRSVRGWRRIKCAPRWRKPAMCSCRSIRSCRISISWSSRRTRLRSRANRRWALD
jgi:SAM-dependent methyltransferase